MATTGRRNGGAPADAARRLPRAVRVAWLLALAAALPVVSSACSRRKQPVPMQGPEPTIPTMASAEPEPAYEPAWLGRLPAVPVPAKEGDRVWATTPVAGSEMAAVGIFTIDRIDGTKATIVDKIGQKTRGLPGGLVHALGTERRPKPGEVVLCYSWTSSAALGRAVRSQGQGALVQLDWAGATKLVSVDHAEPPVRGIAPLAFVAFPKFGRKSKGLVVALTGDEAWIQTSSGHVEIHPRNVLEPLDLGPEVSPGDRVAAYGWTSGFEIGTVRRTLEPGLRYLVEVGEEHVEQPYFFTDLVPQR